MREQEAGEQDEEAEEESSFPCTWQMALPRAAIAAAAIAEAQFRQGSIKTGLPSPLFFSCLTCPRVET